MRDQGRSEDRLERCFERQSLGVSWGRRQEQVDHLSRPLVVSDHIGEDARQTIQQLAAAL